jgi:hypothetical protein
MRQKVFQAIERAVPAFAVAVALRDGLERRLPEGEARLAASSAKVMVTRFSTRARLLPPKRT